jgi:hypothetical protein
MKYYTFDCNNVMEFTQPYMVAEHSNSPFYYDISNGIKLYNVDTFSFLKNIPDN